MTWQAIETLPEAEAIKDIGNGEVLVAGLGLTFTIRAVIRKCPCGHGLYTYWATGADGCEVPSYVTHWMPLPEAPTIP